MVDDIRSLHGDCMELMKEIPDGSVDMILTDPPYFEIARKRLEEALSGQFV